MSDLGWFLIFLLFLIVIGLKATMWILAFLFIYWLVKTGFKND